MQNNRQLYVTKTTDDVKPRNTQELAISDPDTDIAQQSLIYRNLIIIPLSETHLQFLVFLVTNVCSD
jgi:hypothetical protein